MSDGTRLSDINVRPEYLDEHQACEYLGGIPRKTLQRWNSRGTGPRSYKFGRHRRYRPSDLDAWAAQHASDGPEAA
jgi:excisionase family DNA binding protein